MLKVPGVSAYPLEWPQGWPRTPDGQRKNHSAYKVHTDKAKRELFDDLRRMGATHATISSNVAVRQDGAPYADQARRLIRDPGVALHFTLKGKPHTMARDLYARPEDNIRMLGLAVRALYDLERNGGSYMAERAFEGFAALPAPDGVKPKRPWWIVLNYGEDPEARADLSVDEVEARFRSLAKKRHPDVAGDNGDAMAELNEAREEAKRAVGGS